MRNPRMLSLLFAVALAAPTIGYTVGCDRELAHDETTTVKSNGTTAHKETTVKEQPDGTVVKEQQKSVDVPAFEIFFRGVDVDREVEEVGNRDARFRPAATRRRLQHVDAFHDDDVGRGQHDLVIFDDVVRQMGVTRCADPRGARLELGDRPHPLDSPIHDQHGGARLWPPAGAVNQGEVLEHRGFGAGRAKKKEGGGNQLSSDIHRWGDFITAPGLRRV